MDYNGIILPMAFYGRGRGVINISLLWCSAQHDLAHYCKIVNTLIWVVVAMQSLRLFNTPL